MSFLRFANFYCCFIYGYSEITVPLTQLTWKDVPWVFSDDCQESFEKLKKAFVTALVLTHWIPDTPIMVEMDASDYTLAAILSIRTLDGDYHPVAFHSQTFKDTKTNYDMHDKELMAIYDAFKRWRHYLEGAGTLMTRSTPGPNPVPAPTRPRTNPQCFIMDTLHVASRHVTPSRRRPPHDAQPLEVRAGFLPAL